MPLVMLCITFYDPHCMIHRITSNQSHFIYISFSLNRIWRKCQEVADVSFAKFVRSLCKNRTVFAICLTLFVLNYNRSFSRTPCRFAKVCKFFLIFLTFFLIKELETTFGVRKTKMIFRLCRISSDQFYMILL